MKTEKDFVYELLITTSNLNQFNQLKPNSYQLLFEQIAERHLSGFALNVDTTMEHGLAWVLISMSVEISKPVDKSMLLFGNTWYSEHRGPYFRREFLFKNAEGEVMFQGSTHSILFDIEKRTIFRKKQTPFPMHEPNEVFLLNSAPTFKIDGAFECSEERVVQPSHLDCLGHVNNCRYGEFVYDTFTESEQANMINLKRMDINFLSELRAADHFTIGKAYKGNSILFRGHNKTKDDVSFNIALEFMA